MKAIRTAIDSVCDKPKYIDTLFLAPLLFPARPYHALVKDDKLNTDELNNPLNDALKAMKLFYDEVSAFKSLALPLQKIYCNLLYEQEGFKGFFDFLKWKPSGIDVAEVIRSVLGNEVCASATLEKVIVTQPVELAYCISLINAREEYSIVPRWLAFTRPGVEQIMRQLRSTPCLEGCAYCNRALNPQAGLKKYFGFDSYRTFDGKPLQEDAVRAALKAISLLAVFPTGGGKSMTFQIPALMQGQANKGLTVVISPLQSLMKDQVDNLEKAGIVSGVTINGLLDPIERGKAFERVSEGSAQILYLSPESLRSPSIERLLLSRTINRFVIDEAHCFSSWGQDFRVDYQYIGDFIKSYQTQKKLDQGIPVSCFTATAKPQVIEDIQQYFKDKLGLTLELFQSSQSRPNLHYNVYEKDEEGDKFNALRDILDSNKNAPTIVYVSRTKKAEQIADKLSADGFPARVYHGKLDPRTKTENQNAFIAGEVQIMVATSAFGMGVDKKDVRNVVHFEISDSLENYVQEAGRAGRDENMKAECFILFNEEDLNKHFILQNSNKLTLKEINQIWRAVKDMTRFRKTISHSALEVARQAGWDETVNEIETRVTTAIAALEEAGYLLRSQNLSRVYADSIQYKTAQEAINKIEDAGSIPPVDKMNATRIIKSLISSKRRSLVDDDAGESRTDYLADTLGIPHEDVIRIITQMRQEKILADAKDLSAFIGKGDKESRSMQLVNQFRIILQRILQILDSGETKIHLKDLHQELADAGENINGKDIRTALIYMGIKQWIQYGYIDPGKNLVRIHCKEVSSEIESKLRKLHELAPFIISYLIRKSQTDKDESKQQVLVDFSVVELKEAIEQSNDLVIKSSSLAEIEDALFYLNKIDALQLDGGFMILYKRMKLE
ncbi:MAG: RecQ family ATP-dependent DNA helicase, partial [Saprospiraceae bacterium]